MSILGIAHELPDSPTGSFELGQQSFVRKFLVETNDYNDGPATVVNAVGIPRPFQIYTTPNEFHLFARLRTLDPVERKEPNSKFWIITANYSTPQLRSGGPGGDGPSRGAAHRDKEGEQENPLISWPQVETRTEVFQEPVYGVFDSSTPPKFVPCKNSADQVFVPPPMRDRVRLILTITRNEDLLAPHPASQLAYAEHVNSDDFWGTGPGTWKCQSIVAVRETKQLTNGAQFFFLKVTYTFALRETWQAKILDSGSYHKEDINGVVFSKIPFKDQEGHPVQGLLDGHGFALAEGHDVVYQNFQVYDFIAFGALGLPQSFTDVA